MLRVSFLSELQLVRELVSFNLVLALFPSNIYLMSVQHNVQHSHQNVAARLHVWC